MYHCKRYQSSCNKYNQKLSSYREIELHWVRRLWRSVNYRILLHIHFNVTIINTYFAVYAKKLLPGCG
jgi:hypothetical protein